MDMDSAFPLIDPAITMDSDSASSTNDPANFMDSIATVLSNGQLASDFPIPCDNPYKWSAFRSQDYGYTRLVARNHTHIYMEQVSVDLQGKVIDSFWLVKHKLSFNMP